MHEQALERRLQPLFRTRSSGHVARTVRFLTMASIAAVSLLSWRSAEACSFAGPEEHVLDPDEMAVDSTAPDVPVAQLEINRNPEASGSGCGQTTTNSCEGTGVVALTVTAQDDRTMAESMGYELVLAGGELPEGMTLPTGPVKPGVAGPLVLIFLDSDQDIDFTLAVRAVDLAGNMGEPVEVEIVDGGSGSGGCRVTSSHQAVSMALLVLGLLFVLRRRNLEKQP